jgi:hypothetical protein
MNTLKRATIVTLVAGSALIMATTAAFAAPAVTADETGQVSQSGVQGQSGELDRNASEQTGVQGQSGELDRNSNEQSGDQSTSGDGANSQSGDQSTAGDGANGQSGENK